MSTEHFGIFLFAYLFVATLVMLFCVLAKNGSRLRLLGLIIAVLGLILSIVIGSMLYEGQNFLIGLMQQLLRLSRTHTVALLLGVSAAVPLALLPGFRKTRWVNLGGFTLATLSLLGVILFGGFAAGKELLSPYLSHPESATGGSGIGSTAPQNFTVELVAETEIVPIRVAVSDTGRIYVSGHIGIAAQDGGVVELVSENGKTTEKKVAELLNRPYGLYAGEDYLLVSRSGQHTQWQDGKASHVSTGAVTRLSDTDGDGVMDYYHDVVSDLPGAKGPDPLHQNNDLVIGEDGAIYFTTANHTDSRPVADDKAGAILRAAGPDFNEVEVFASGLRNPFGIAFDAEGQLFVTDNDAQGGLVGGNQGDKLLRVNRGDFFGHPFGDGNSDDVKAAELRSSFALGGLTLASSDKLPDEYRNKLFLVVYGEGRIMMVEPTGEGEDATFQLKPFAIVPGAVDIAAAPDGSFYVAVYPDKVMKIRYDGN